MSVHKEIEKLREQELSDSLIGDSRSTVRIRRDNLRAAILQEEGIDLEDWAEEEPTGVHHIPTMKEMVTEKIKAIKPVYPQICKACRDQFVDSPEDFHCADCKTEKIDKGWK